MLMAVCHSAQDGWLEVEDHARLSDLRAQEGNLLWADADIADLTRADVETIAEEFGLHDLAVEDAIHTRQRPKLERYEHHLFLVVHQLDEIDDQVEASQISCFIGDRHVLTLHNGAQRTLAAAKTRWDHDQSQLGVGPPYLLYTLMDVIVDDYQDIADRLETEIEDLEDILLQTPTAPVGRQLYSVKQRTARLRRYVQPLTRMFQEILDPEYGEQVPQDARNFFRDVEDHVLRISDQVRNIEDLDDAAIDLRRAAEAEKLNETTKKLTGWAAIIAVPTLISGVYGMNVGIVPRAGSRLGFWGVLGAMALVSIVLYWNFKKKKWI